MIEDIRLRLPVSFELTSYALIFATLVGVPLGIIAAVMRNKMGDHLVRVFTIFVTSTPAFWAGLVSIYIFFYLLGWAPAPTGMLPISILPPERVTGMLTIDALIAGDFEVLAAAMKSFALPVIIFGLSTTPQISRITRSAMIEALQEDYVTLARSIGLPEWRVILQDAFRGSLVPVLTTILNFAGVLFLGNALIEQVFSWPGMGHYLINAVSTNDLAPVNTVIVLVASLVAIINLFGDIGYAIIDPRIRHGFVSSD